MFYGLISLVGRGKEASLGTVVLRMQHQSIFYDLDWCTLYFAGAVANIDYGVSRLVASGHGDVSLGHR